MIFKFIPFDWIAVSGIATLLMAIATFYSLYQYKLREKESTKREIYEKILQPLHKSLQNLTTSLEHNFPRYYDLSWGEVKSNLYLISKIDIALKGKIEEFDLNFQRFKNLLNQQYSKVVDVVCESIVNAVGAKQYFSGISSQQKEYLISSNFMYSIGGKNYFVSFWQLILGNKDLSEFIEGTKRSGDIKSDYIENEHFNINGDNVILKNDEAELLRAFIAIQPRKHFENALSKLKNAITEDNELKMLIDDMYNIHKQANLLKKRIEKF